MNNSKQLAKISITLILAVLFLSGCSLDTSLDDRLEWLDGKASRLFEAGDEDQTVIEAMEDGETGDTRRSRATGRGSDQGQEEEQVSANNLTAEEKLKIDQWLEEQGYNRYGDDSKAIYVGTPLFNEATGQAIERYDYILNKFPNILERIEE